MTMIQVPEPFKIITFTGASGAGKTTIVKELLDQRIDYQMLTSLTTREKRSSDLPNEYKYLTEEQFEKRKKKDEFIWTFSVHGYRVGTLTADVRGAFFGNYGIVHLMILIPEGVQKLRKSVSYDNVASILSFYVFSPAEKILRQRLIKRGDDDSSINRRISDCKIWDKEANTSGIPYIFIDNSGLFSDTIRQINEYLPLPPKNK